MLISSAKFVHSSVEGERCSDSFRLGNQKEADRRSAKRPMGPRESPPDTETQIRISKRKGAMPFGFLLECLTCFLNRSLLSHIKSGPVVSEEMGKTDWFAAENLLYILSHGSSLALAIEPLQI